MVSMRKEGRRFCLAHLIWVFSYGVCPMDVTKKSDFGEVVVSFMEISSYIFMQVGFEFESVVCIVKIWYFE